MRMQNSQANCGPTAMQNALDAMGIVRSIEECEKLCGCTAIDGTSPGKLFKGLEAVHELDPSVLSETREEVALALLELALRAGRPVILLVDDAGHWVAAIGLLGKRIQIADGASNELVMSYPIGAFATRWATKSAKRGRYYGIRL